jgi:hypothetical protein
VTSLANQVRICGHHHGLITNEGYALTGDHAAGWHLRAPPDTGWARDADGRLRDRRATRCPGTPGIRGRARPRPGAA